MCWLRVGPPKWVKIESWASGSADKISENGPICGSCFFFLPVTPVAWWYKDALWPRAITRNTERIGFSVSHRFQPSTNTSVCITVSWANKSSRWKSSPSDLSALCCAAHSSWRSSSVWQKIWDNLMTTHNLWFTQRECKVADSAYDSILSMWTRTRPNVLGHS